MKIIADMCTWMGHGVTLAHGSPLMFPFVGFFFSNSLAYISRQVLALPTRKGHLCKRGVHSIFAKSNLDTRAASIIFK